VGLSVRGYEKVNDNNIENNPPLHKINISWYCISVNIKQK